MKYKTFEIVFKPDTNKYAIIDHEHNNQEIICVSVQACKVRVSKLVKTRQYIKTLLGE